MRPRESSTTFDRALQFCFALLIVVVLVFLGLSLYTFPIPDSARYWFGDESWLMLEARSQILTGILRHPYAYGATIFHFVGIMGSTWLTSFFYGLPAAIFSRRLPIILIGRTVTFGIAIVVCFEFARLLLRATTSLWYALFGLLLLITTPAFAIASHSARPDLLIGLVVLLVVGYFTKRVDLRYDHVSQWIGFGAIMSILGLTIALHLVTLLVPFSLYVIWQKGGFRKYRFVLSAVLGAALVAGLLATIYYLTTGDLSLYGTHGQHVQFMDVTNQKPILRPFSRSVQWNNLTQRIALLLKGAPAIVLLLACMVVQVFYDLLRHKASYLQQPELRFMTVATILLFFSWLLLQTSVEYYLPHFLLLLVLWLTSLLSARYSDLFRNVSSSTPAKVAFLVVAMGLSAWHVHRIRSQAETGKIFSALNAQAESKLYASITKDALSSGISNPLVLAESPCAINLETETTFRIMAPAFIDFPERSESAESTFRRYGVNYALLYSSSLSSVVGDTHDSVATAVERSGILIDKVVGTSFDLWRSYDRPGFDAKDTMKLYKMR